MSPPPSANQLIVIRPAADVRIRAINAPAGKDPWAEPVQNISASGSLLINYELGKHIRLTVAGNISSVLIINWPQAGFLGRITLEITTLGAFSLAGWPAQVLWPAGNAPNLTAMGQDHIVLTTSDGGATVFGHPVGFSYS